MRVMHIPIGLKIVAAIGDTGSGETLALAQVGRFRTRDISGTARLGSDPLARADSSAGTDPAI